MGKKKQNQEDLLETLGDFTSKENWDTFFTIRGGDDSFEWYAEWPQLKDPLLSVLSPSPPPSQMQILVPGCGNSRLSEHLYDAGFPNITNVDFSKVVISDMLRRNVRSRPEMKWRIMDMTSMQFGDETFDAILDKGALDALMEPELGPKLGDKYLSEVKRLLKVGGKFVCLTLAESHVLGLLFPKFRYGWKLNLHAIPQKPSDKSGLQTFMLVGEKDNFNELRQIISLTSQSSISSSGSQARGLQKEVDSENKIRSEWSTYGDMIYSLEDLKIGIKGDLAELNPGRRVQLTLGEPGVSRFSYSAVLLDAQDQSIPFNHQYGVFLVPKTRAHEWLFFSEEGQWLVVESSKAARLLMILLDSSHTDTSMDDIQNDLSPLVKQLAPKDCSSGTPIPFMAASDGVKERKIVHQVTSSWTGPIIVDDVIYEKTSDAISSLLPSKDAAFRRLTFQRTEGLVQSEALLIKEESRSDMSDLKQKKTQSSTKSKKRGNQKMGGFHASLLESTNNLKVDHSYLASSYHTGIISGLMLISTYLRDVASNGGTAKAVVLGLGAGLLPMFLHQHLPFLDIEVVELDPVVAGLAKNYFGFEEDEHLKVHIMDGVQYVLDIANLQASELATVSPGEGDLADAKAASNGITGADTVGENLHKVDVIIVDVDSPESSSGLTCPAADFVEESFLLNVKRSLSEQGLFIVNLVSRSSTIKGIIFTRMKQVFSNLFSLQLEEDVNEVVLALNTEVCTEDSFLEARDHLSRLLDLEHHKWSKNIMDSADKIRRL